MKELELKVAKKLIEFKINRCPPDKELGCQRDDCDKCWAEHLISLIRKRKGYYRVKLPEEIIERLEV